MRINIAYKKIIASIDSRVKDESLAKELKEDVLEILKLDIEKSTKIEFVFDYVCREFQADPEKVKCGGRKNAIVIARHSFRYCAKQVLGQNSLKTIGMITNHSDHSTVINSIRVVNDIMSYDKLFKKKIEDLVDNLRVVLG